MGIRVFGRVKFDGVDLADFGVTLSGTGTFNAPERDVTYMSVPGRNGDLIYDNGRYKNIQVTYPINIELGLPDKVKALRSFLLSHKGYFRLEDSYHTDEFRMAQYVGPFEISPTGSNNRYGRMELTFDCKPQRFLKAGENEASYTGTATKPTYYAMTDIDLGNRTIISNAATTAGYNPNDITEWVVLDITGYGIQAYDLLSFEVGTNQPFFCVLFQNNPLTSTSTHPTAEYEKVIAFSTPTMASYVVLPRFYNLRVYLNGVLKEDDAAFDYFTLNNPTLFNSKPLLKFDLKSSVTDYIGGIGECGIYFDTTVDPNVLVVANTLTIDAVTMDAYVLPEDNVLGLQLNCNKMVSFTQYEMTLAPGENSILVNANTNGLEIIPRWWRL